jgi:hypothetical protein
VQLAARVHFNGLPGLVFHHRRALRGVACRKKDLSPASLLRVAGVVSGVCEAIFPKREHGTTQPLLLAALVTAAALPVYTVGHQVP